MLVLNSEFVFEWLVTKNKEVEINGPATLPQKLLLIYILQKTKNFPVFQDRTPLANLVEFLTGQSNKNIFDGFSPKDRHKLFDDRNTTPVKALLKKLKLNEALSVLEKEMKDYPKKSKD